MLSLLRPDSIERAPRLVVWKQPVVARASWLISRWISSARPRVPVAKSPSHHSSAPNIVVDWTHAAMTFLQLAGVSPICPVSRRSLVNAFLPSFIRVAWCSFRESWASSQIPSHLVAALLNGTLLVPTATVAVGTDRFLWNSAASVLP